MQRFVFLIAGIFIFTSIFAFAQDPDDPGIPDSLIIGSVEVDYAPGEWTYVDVPIYFVTDDSVSDFFLPITWNSTDDQIYPTEVSWLNVFQDWEEAYDSIRTDDGYIRCLGFHDLGGDIIEPLLYTDAERLQGMTVTFAISPDAEEQTCQIDTAIISNTFRLYFGLIRGYVDFVPVFVPGTITLGEGTDVEDERASLPSEFILNQNYPNPFNPETNIEYQIPEPAFVSIEIFNILGQKVKTLVSESKEAGYHQARWDGASDSGRDVPSGVYFYRMNAGNFSQTMKMVMLK